MKDNISRLSKTIATHELISGSFYIFIGSIIANFLAFLLNLFMARSLSYSDYGTFASILALIILVTMPATSINTVIVRFATDYFSRGDIQSGASLYRDTLKIISILSFILFILFFALSFQIKSFLNLDNILYPILMGFIVAISYISVINTAFLQSLLKFKFMSFVVVLGSSARLIAGIILVLLGLRVFGALWAIVAMSLSSIFIGFIPLRHLLSQKKRKSLIKDKEIFYFAILAAISIFSLASFTSVDVILVKHLFSSQDAGLYSGLSLIGKVIFYFTIPITTVMFPLLIKRHAKGEKISGLFYFVLMIVGIISFSITFFYYIFPRFVISFFLGGGEYLTLVPYLAFFGVFITLFNMVSVFVSFFLSIKKVGVAFIVLMGAIFQIVLIFIFHENFFQIINISIISLGATFISLCIYYIKLFVNFKSLGRLVIFLNDPRS